MAIVEFSEVEYWSLPVNKIVHGNALDVLKKFPSESVDVIVTSPPYFGKRDYGEEAMTVWGGSPNCEHEWEFEERLNSSGGFPNPEKAGVGKEKLGLARFYVREATCKKCGAWYGQLGLEPTPEMFIEHLLMITKELKRVLKDSGLLFWVMDDTYGGSMLSYGIKNWSGKSLQNPLEDKYPNKFLPPQARCKRKTLLLIPERLAMRMVDEQDWILRNMIIWYKKNHLPESVTDRFTRSYEFIFMFSKSEKYYSNLDAVRVPHEWGNKDRRAKMRRVIKENSKYENGFTGYHPKGKNPSDMWVINTKPFKGAHFAVFPEELVERILKFACPENGIVLDPFLGSGTTALVALRMGFRFVGIEINKEYCELAYNRIKEYLNVEKITNYLR